MSDSINSVKTHKMIIFGSWLGWALDGYDLVLMLFVISSVSQLFFPAEDQKLSLLATFATYAITLVVRPIGGALFGVFGDKLGRKKAMIITIIGFSIATFSTGLLPTWQAVGILAPLFLIALRFSQGLFAGGEWGSGAVISMESVPKSSRGMTSGFIQSGFPFGFLLASLVYWIVSTQYPGASFIETGWRLMFFTGIIPSLLALILRIKMNESDVWTEKLKQQSLEKTPFKKVIFGEHKKPFLVTLIITTGLMYAYYASIGFMPTLLADFVHLGRTEIALMMAYATFSSILGYIFSGWISQKIGRIKTMTIFSSLTVILAIPLMFGLFNASGLDEKIIYNAILVMIATSGFGPMPAFLSERFPTQIRNTSAGFVFNSGLIIGAWAPLISIEASKLNWSAPVLFGINLMAGCIVTIIGLRFNPETKDVDLRTVAASHT